MQGGLTRKSYASFLAAEPTVIIVIPENSNWIPTSAPTAQGTHSSYLEMICIMHLYNAYDTLFASWSL